MTGLLRPLLVSSLVVLAGLHVRPQPADPAPAGLPAVAVPGLAARLAALTPIEPSAYYELAEEVAFEAADERGRQLARELYVLAYELDRSRGAPLQIGAGVCIGLAALAGTEPERRWLRALGSAIDPLRRPEPDWAPPTPGPTLDEAAFDLATALGLIRAGEGRRAERIMERSEVLQLLDRYAPVLQFAGSARGPSQIRRDMDTWWNCPECFQRGMNQRFVSRPAGLVRCPTCAGNPGPVLSVDALIAELRLESLLLSGAHRSWAAQAVADDGAPLRDLDPDELARTYGVRPDAPYFRDGAWSGTP